MIGWSGIGGTDIMLHAARTGVDELSIPVALSTAHLSGELW